MTKNAPHSRAIGRVFGAGNILGRHSRTETVFTRRLRHQPSAFGTFR